MDFKLDQCGEVENPEKSTVEKQYKVIYPVIKKDYHGNNITDRVEGRTITLSQAREEYEKLGEIIAQIQEMEK